MYRIKLSIVIAILFFQWNIVWSQANLSLLDSIIGIHQSPKGITVYPIDFQKIKVSEALLLELNAAHYEGIAQSGVVSPKIDMSKRYVKKNEYDVSLADVMGHLPHALISTLKVLAFEQHGASDSEYTVLKSIDFLAQHAIYDVSTGKQIHSFVLHIKPNVSGMNNREEQNQLLSKTVTEQIKNSMIFRFPALSFLQTINTVEKDKAISVDVENSYANKTQKKDLYVNVLKSTFYLNNKSHYLFETIGRVDFDNQIDGKLSNYKVKKGKKEINEAFNNKQTIILSIRPME